MCDFPDNCIRGIAKRTQISIDRANVLAAVFMPNSKTAETREDGCQETSINWEDNEEVMSFTLNHRPSPDQFFSYPNGAVRVPRAKIDDINTFNGTQDGVFYERQKIPGNDYHGNIVFKKELTKTQINFIANMLAAASSNIHTRETMK